MAELSEDLKKDLRKLANANHTEATFEQLAQMLKPYLQTHVEEEESVFIRKARRVLNPPSPQPKQVKKQESKPLAKKEQKLSPLETVFVKLIAKIEAVKAKLFEGHGSGVNADKLDDYHADELIVKAASVARKGGGGNGLSLSIADSRYVNVSGDTMAGDLDMDGNDFYDLGELRYNVAGANKPKWTWDDTLGAFVPYYGAGLTDIYLEYLFADAIKARSSVTGLDIRTGLGVGSSVDIQTYNGAALQSVLTAINGQLQFDNSYEKTAGHGQILDGVLLKDGNVDVGTGGTFYNGDIAFYRVNSQYFRIMDSTKAAWRGLQMGWLQSGKGISHYAASGYHCEFKTQSGLNYPWDFKAYDGAAMQVCAQLGSASDAEFIIQRAGNITMLDQKMMQFGTYTDAQRPAAGTAGRWIFNTDDGMPNYDDGTNWRDINGNIT